MIIKEEEYLNDRISFKEMKERVIILIDSGVLTCELRCSTLLNILELAAEHEDEHS